jgi:hypothetical protein
VPVLVSASDLAGTDSLSDAVAHAVTCELRGFGLDGVPADFFRRAPRPRVAWLVLVDGLDEIADTNTRKAVLRMVSGAESRYRFVVATRPLPAGELNSNVPCYELQPFTPEDLHEYATRWLGSQVDQFTTAGMGAHLDALARKPLIASMLCQLYAAERPLPTGRTGAYQSFVELIYEQNAHKHVGHGQSAAIQRLTSRYQIPETH